MTPQSAAQCALSSDLALHSADALIAIGLDRTVLSFNPAAEQLLGLPERDAIGRSCGEILKSSLCDTACPLHSITAGQTSVTNFNVNLHLSQGTPLPVCIVSSPLCNAAGETVGMVESVRDVRHVVRLIAEKHAAAEQARHAASWLGAIVETINDAVIATDAGILITCFNRAAELLTGYSRHEVLGRSCRDVFSNGFCPLEETLRDQAGIPGLDLFVRGKDGRAIPVWLTTQLLRDDSGQVVGAVQMLRERLDAPRPGLHKENRYSPLIGNSPVMRNLYRWIDRLAPSDTTVLLQGESGSGKELVAEVLHVLSPRCDKPLIRVNCAAMPESLLESEMFGHVRGAFTGAIKDRPGRFELAQGGTLFLDEIGDLPLPLQPKLLRVLQDRCVERLGSGRPIPLDIRVIAASNRDLPAMVASGSFRQDLYFRLAVVPLSLPPLREHPEDLLVLSTAFLGKLAARRNHSPLSLTTAALHSLAAHSWPGNVRELENALEFASIRASGHRIDLNDLPESIRRPRARVASHSNRIAEAIAHAPTAAQAALALGISRATLFRHMKKLGLHKPH